MDVAEALRRAGRVLPPDVGVTSIDDVLDIDEPRPQLVPIVMTTELSFDHALAAYHAARAHRATSGLSPIIVACEAFEHLGVFDWLTEDGRPDLDRVVAEHAATTADDFFTRRIGDGGDPMRAIEDALDRLGRLSKRDPLTILHRLDPDDLAVLDGGEPDDEIEIDFDDLPYPDDVREAYRMQHAERELAAARARRNGGATLMPPVRAPDRGAALKELHGVRSRLALVASSPAMALLHLGFGMPDSWPDPHEHARVWERWEHSIGAEPVYVDTARVAGTIECPVDTRPTLVRLVRQAALYDRDLLENGWLALAGQLYRNASIGFWWD